MQLGPVTKLEEEKFSVPSEKVFDTCHVDKSLLIETQIQDVQEDHLFVKETTQETIQEPEVSVQEFKVNVMLTGEVNQSSEIETKDMAPELNCFIHHESRTEKIMQEIYRALTTEEHNIHVDDLEIRRDLKGTAVVFQGISNLTNLSTWKTLEVAFAWSYKLQNLLNELPLKEKELSVSKRITKQLYPP